MPMIAPRENWGGAAAGLGYEPQVDRNIGATGASAVFTNSTVGAFMFPKDAYTQSRMLAMNVDSRIPKVRGRANVGS